MTNLSPCNTMDLAGAKSLLNGMCVRQIATLLQGCFKVSSRVYVCTFVFRDGHIPTLKIWDKHLCDQQDIRPTNLGSDSCWPGAASKGCHGHAAHSQAEAVQKGGGSVEHGFADLILALTAITSMKCTGCWSSQLPFVVPCRVSPEILSAWLALATPY